ncbi:hypothetical protein Clacol_001793 [Clathrus columnatus]|uniref:Beta-mannosidase B n=1 Tax=Clathrus columnatus TaxID=1419009 RepID=A0AAV5A046_9AGAM|nr:hypothetical protein Clacol_001793 [Clathrus columnatus]
MATVRTLDKNWKFALLRDQKPVDQWHSILEIPTSVHVELLKADKIPDPFVGSNEWDVQSIIGIGESDWIFSTTFDLETNDPNVDLVFEGLDTYSVVHLNGNAILQTSNMFVPYRVLIKSYLVAGPNELTLTFPSTFLKGKDLEKKHGKLNLWNGDSSRLHVRKAQYNYGWDWGPVLMTVGPWRPIRIHSYTSRMTDLKVSTDVTESLDVTILVSVETDASEGNIDITIKDPKGTPVQNEISSLKDGKAVVKFTGTKDQFDLWYPIGYGKQPLYTVQVQFSDQNGHLLDSKQEKIGLRRVRLVQDELVAAEGRSFLFEVNNIRIFCGGSNWIPADSFLTKVTPEVYKAWLQLLVDGNQNMIRVWGGGIYVREMGILVWQDFMFGCGQYPAYDDFLKEIREEAEANVKRLRHHPSIVIFAGNNEDYQLAESLKLQLDYSDETSDFRGTNFPARHIYERVLPEIVSQFSDIIYHRTVMAKLPPIETTGNVWHGTQEPWHNWDKLSGRFVSEFGMEGFPNIRTVDYWLDGKQEERYPQSRLMDVHNKADGWQRRLELYLIENFKHAFDMESYVYYTQIMQAETLASAYRLWRREWRGKGREYCAGALVWQLNDCWPVTSWAIVDYFLRPKPAYYAIARELKPYTVGITRKDKKVFADDRTAAFFTINTIVEIWGTNKTLEEKNVKLDITAFNLDDPSWKHHTSEDVILQANSSTELFKGDLPGQPIRTTLSETPLPIILHARLIDSDGTVLSRYSNWPEPFKFIKFPAPEIVGLKITVEKDGEAVHLSCKRPIKGIILDVDGNDVVWSDQAIDLVPDDEQTIKAVGLNDRKIKAQYLGDGSA